MQGLMWMGGAQQLAHCGGGSKSVPSIDEKRSIRVAKDTVSLSGGELRWVRIRVVQAEVAYLVWGVSR